MSLQVNGKAYDWADVNVYLPLGELNLQSIEYGDEHEKELTYGTGNMPRGYGSGNYKASCKLSLLLDDFEKIKEYCREQGVGLYKLMIPKIVVSYGDDGGLTKTDEITKVSFAKIDDKAAQGDKTLPVEIECCVSGKIIRDGVKPM